MGFKVKEGIAKARCLHSARAFRTGSKSRRIKKKLRSRITLTVCSGCGAMLKQEG